VAQTVSAEAIGDADPEEKEEGWRIGKSGGVHGAPRADAL
jgi:hypothetical protein